MKPIKVYLIWSPNDYRGRYLVIWMGCDRLGRERIISLN